MDVQKITSDEYQEVEQYIALSHSATGFHSPGWIHVLGNAFNVKPLFLRSRDGDGNINGLLPLFRSKSLLFGDFICSLEDGHCAENHDAAQALSRCANELLSVEGAKYLNYKTNFTQPTAQDGIAPFDTQVVETVKTVVSTDIDSEKLFSSLSSNTRRKVRKASREGYTVNNSVKHLEHEFYPIYSTNLHRLGTPVFSAAMFEQMSKHLGDHLAFYAIEHDNTFVGGMVCLKARNEWTSLYVAIEDDAQKKYAGYLLYWTALEDAARNGASRFNLGRSTVGSGAHRYKLQWAGEDIMAVHNFLGQDADKAANRLKSATGKEGLKTKVWKKLPEPVANLAGQYLRKPLPFV